MNVVTKAAEGFPRRAFTVDDIGRMIEVGIIGEHENFELIEGDLVVMAAKHIGHDGLKNELTMALARSAPDGVFVAIECTLQLAKDILVEPDIAIVSRAVYAAARKSFARPRPDDAPLLIESLPYTQIFDRLPWPVRRLLDGVPIIEPVLPDPGVPFQLVHHDDVASAMRAAVLGRGTPGIYNLAGPGQLTVSQLASELGWYSIPVPELAVGALAEMVGRLGFLPAQAQWIAAFREPVIMDTAKARRELHWRPKHDALQTLRETIVNARLDRFIR